MLTLIAVIGVLILASTLAVAFILHRWHTQWLKTYMKAPLAPGAFNAYRSSPQRTQSDWQRAAS